MDRVITIQCQLPPEPLTLDENTMLSPLEEEALSKCSQAENMVSTRADGCFKTLKREVSEPKAVFFKPLSPIIYIQILQTDLYIFP